MKQWSVEMRGEAREVYVVEADTEQEARETWMNGWLQLQESLGMDIVSVSLDYEED